MGACHLHIFLDHVQTCGFGNPDNETGVWLQTFVYTLCQAAIRPSITMLLGLGPSRRMQEMVQPAVLQQAMTDKET